MRTPSPLKSTLLGMSITGLMLSAPAANANFDESMERALQVGGGQIKLDLRYRFENVNEEDVARKTANADTLRLRLGYLTPKFWDFQAYAEYEGNQDIFTNQYNSTRNRKTQYSTIADPQENEINQLWIGYFGLRATEVKVGRQRITYDNHRFIGNVGWRQLEQTYDSVAINTSILPETTVQMAYLWRVRDIFSKNVNMSSPLLNITYSGLPFAKITTYGYWLDYDDNLDSGNFSKSTQTYGLRIVGSYPATPDIKLLYTAEYAYQEDYQRNPVDYDADYWHLMGGLGVGPVTAKAGVEILGSDNGRGFQTPLATLHAFQGWADIFLNTPGDGIRDVYALLSVTPTPMVELTAIYHEFDDDTGSIDFGNEIDAQVNIKLSKHYGVLAKFAYYDAKDFAVNTQKVWLQTWLSF